MSAEEHRLTELFRRHGAAIERRCGRLLRDPVEARDAAQETFARSVSSLRGLDSDVARLALLYRVSTNVCFNQLKKRRLGSTTWWGQLAAHAKETTEPYAAVDARLTVANLMRLAVDELTRQLVLFTELDGMSQGEAAQVLGVSRATANARLTHFHEQMRKLKETE